MRSTHFGKSHGKVFFRKNQVSETSGTELVEELDVRSQEN